MGLQASSFDGHKLQLRGSNICRLLNVMFNLVVYVHAVNMLDGWFLPAVFFRELTPEKVKEVEEVKGPSIESPCNINTEANKIQSFEKSTTDTLKRDRENHFLLNFSRALWNVLKEYKNKLEKDNLSPCEYIVFDKEYLKDLEDKDFSSEIAALYLVRIFTQR
ncbi:hypothetical protein L2E82_45821 [Cichorium intybus]|uniref:Uncharacterized protein n=1 Tax=Cichorium intybus TaxID=13427 RepID=A0ACB8ZT59_CICIN|nr:hypothetical protein L2E82_45821 [Cichorium intybus]